MIKVAILFTMPKEYKGGVNYLQNLCFAVSKVNKGDLGVVLVVPADLPQEYIDMFKPYCTVIKSILLQRNSVPWFVDKVIEKITGYRIFTDNLLKKYRVDVVSHSFYVPQKSKFKSINWIADFQYLHYPNLWTKAHLKDTVSMNDHLVANSDIMILSSFDALKDFKTAYPDNGNKSAVVHFVSQPQKRISQEYINQTQETIKKYVVKDTPYFYLPNQFWTHKNHLTAFKACKILNEKGIKFHLLTSGYMKDFRSNDDHVAKLISYVNDNNLNNTVKFLGLIPYADVLDLIINATALINPSYFEGWSSTVEEARSAGTLTLLSDIAIHREQDPLGCKYFSPNSETELANLMEGVLNGAIEYNRPSSEYLNQDLEKRTIAFGQQYISLVKSLIN
jgi:glycosyltransferase involved in cell wall biosynthesis